MIHLASIELRDLPDGRSLEFPFSVPAIGALSGCRLELRSEVTFLVGENGSGKSTFLEGIACAARSIAVGTADVERDPTLRAGQALARWLRLSWTRKTRRGFYMRAEDFFGYAQRMEQVRAELEAEARAIQVDATLSDRARGFALQGYARELGGIRERYGDGLDARSHGEGFLTLFRSRFVPDGLYLLDEPEAPLSPTRQLSLIAMMKTMVAEEGAQFVIATHSPILMSFPGATILSFDGGAIREVPYQEVEHVTVTRQFLNDPDAFLRHL
ncbi:MAG: AAA family ATPase [Thermomicrobiales bacterium]